MTRRQGDEDPVTRARRAGAADRDQHIYERRRRTLARRRAERERKTFDPAPPTQDEWVVPVEGSDGIRRIGPPTALAESLSDYVDRRGWTERLRGTDAWSRWEQIVGVDLSQRCEPVRLAGGTLVVRAESQVWATQLRYLLPQLRANADEALGTGTVRDVRIVVGPLEGTGPDRD